MFKTWFQKKNNQHLPAFWQDYEANFGKTFSKNMPIEEVEFVIFDTETTGLDIRKDKVLSLGAVRIVNNRLNVSESMDFLIAQEGQMFGKNAEIHGILNAHAQNGLSEREALEKFVTFCKDAVLVGHHVTFDVAMLDQIAKKIVGRRLKNKTIDTLDLAKRVNPPGAFVRPGDYSLDRLCQLYHLPTSDRHTAAGDAYITALLLMKLFVRLRKRGVRTLGQLLRS